MIITGAVFDLDGTLIDSMPMWHNFVGVYLDKYSMTPDDYLKANAKDMSFAQAAEYINEHYPLGKTKEEIEKDMEATAADAYANTIAIKHDVKPFLFALRCKGVRMCIATASPREWAESALKRLNIDHYFSVILSCYDLKTSKSDPMIYDRAFDILGTDRETTYVFEDSVNCIRTAKAAGYKVIGVKDEMSAPDEEEIKRLSDIYIKDFDDFRGMVR
ncbi:MAG: HAD-IA family hydrolase [Clostridia bacterium]|nr:HAD-IA family hydrolase [Clostridia bacterium]